MPLSKYCLFHGIVHYERRLLSNARSFWKEIDQLLLSIAGHDDNIGDVIIAKPVDDPSDDGSPATFKSVLWMVSVSGRILLPYPAARIMAFITSPSK